MNEDLYRQGKKPYVDYEPSEDLNDEEAAQAAWGQHTLRNGSVVTDLFHGQYKSTINCNQCDRVSVTYDPMSTVMVSIPPAQLKFKFFYLPYTIGEKFHNFTGSVTVKSSDTIGTLRKKIQEKYGIGADRYTISKVTENEFKQFYNCHKSIPEDQIECGGKNMLLYEVRPDLKTGMPDMPDKTDSNNGISSDWTRLIVNMCYLNPGSYSYSQKQKKSLPRLMWINKNWNMKQLHMEVFIFIRQLFAEWLRLNKERNEKAPQFPFHPANTQITKEQFMQLDHQ